MRFVAINNLQAGMTLGRKISNRKSTLMLERGMTLSESMIVRLKEQGYIGAYISDSFSDEVEFCETVSDETAQQGRDAVAEANIESILKVATEMVAEISAIDNINVDILDLRSFDDYTYHHSVNVAVYATAVGVRMGLSSEENRELAIAALCHDLGKEKIPEGIINKESSLSDEEFEEIKRHPKYGYDILLDNSDINPRIRQAVLCHHENENGSGYPNGKVTDDIPLYAKIIHVVDVFDALTSRRPYKDPYASVDALEYLIGGCDILFDRKVVEVMMDVVPSYPPGMDVRLSNGEKAIVISHTNQALRPTIKIYGSDKIIDLSTNLTYRSVYIVASGIMLQEETGSVDTLNEDRGNPNVRKKIMIVDDSTFSLGQTRVALEDEYDIIALESGLACLNYIKEKGDPDLLIMDIDMPLMDGTQAVKKLREKGHKKLNVMFLTAISDKETVNKCISVGAKDYIIKPINPVYLKERVKIALDKTLER